MACYDKIICQLSKDEDMESIDIQKPENKWSQEVCGKDIQMGINNQEPW